MDEWLRERIDHDGPPDVAAVARRLASYGVTCVTDATPSTSLSAVSLLERACPVLRVVATGGPPLAAATFPVGVERGPVKIVIGDHALPGLDEVVEDTEVAHAAGRPVAVHCVTRAALALAVAAWRTAGAVPGDRVEHASIAPPELVDEMAGLGLAVVTQPAFVAARGDVYLADVDPEDRPHLYRCASLRAAGIPVGASSDAPFGPEDPWWAMRAAVDRRTASGAVVGEDERVPAADALAMFLSPPDHPGAPPRRIKPGSPCNVVVLDCPLEQALTDLDASHVRLTISAGQITYTRDG
jgi:predicted amidohydrolase YtcJ